MNISEKAGSLMDHADDRRFLQPHDDGFRHRRGRRHAQRLPGEASFAEEFVRSENCDDGFLALLGNDGDLHLAFLDVEDRIRRVALRKDGLVLAYLADAAPSPTLARKALGSSAGAD